MHIASDHVSEPHHIACQLNLGFKYRHPEVLRNRFRPYLYLDVAFLIPPSRHSHYLIGENDPLLPRLPFRIVGCERITKLDLAISRNTSSRRIKGIFWTTIVG